MIEDVSCQKLHLKMADVTKQISVQQMSNEEEDLPPPPPPPLPPRPIDYEGPMAMCSLPVPPPKETFSTFYQQRQKSELKRLFKHIHPDLHASLDDATDDEIMKVIQSQGVSDAHQGEVQSMRWIFENWTLDNIGDPHETKKLLDVEELKGGDVRNTSSMFEHCERHPHLPAERQTSVRGDVRTSTWLFETQPLDCISKSKRDEAELVEALLIEPKQSGDVKGTQLLFESKTLSDLGRCNSTVDYSVLKLKSELQEQKGDVKKCIKLFQTDPCCAIRDNKGNIHEIKSVCREETDSGKFSSTRWLFETQPLDTINKESDGVKIIRGISLEEGHKEGVDHKRWMFETQSFDTIKEVIEMDKSEGRMAAYNGETDVTNQSKMSEMQPAASTEENITQKSQEKDVIIGGDVRTSLWLFETQPVEALSDSYEFGHLKKITLSDEEQGEVKGKKIMFENGSLNNNLSLKKQDIEKGDVKGFKQLFETIPLGKMAQTDKKNENYVSSDRGMETSPLYAIQDSSGNLHGVTTVSREECITGRVQNYKWMFETKPIDQLEDRRGSVELIKGITRQEDSTGDVKMAKWLFETQTMDGIHCKFNQTDNISSGEEDTCKGDVKNCKWLFETQPMDVLYEKTEKEKDKDLVDTDVKSITWLFESQPLDSFRDAEPFNLKLYCATKDPIKSEVGVQSFRHLFETEILDKTTMDLDSEANLRCISQVNFQSGDVSRVKELFESQSLDEIGSEILTKSGRLNQEEQIKKGSVHKFTWMFENCPMNQINNDPEDATIEKVGVLETGDVQNKKFIFETSSLDKIQTEPLEHGPISVDKPEVTVDVKSSTMMFESMPLYAIRDKEGQFHEVTTVKKEEVMSGDVRGARWMFETKPLDAIKAENEVYVIRAVTQEDVKKGDVQSARWKFETQPLDSLTEREELPVLDTADFGSSNVQSSKKIFESEQSCKKFVRMVSVTDVQRGDVRTSTWLFENQTLDSLKGEPEEQSPVKTVHREDSQKGDVKRCTWLFESQPLDKIKESQDPSEHVVENIPSSDVKCTTWLFETTPLDKITASSVADTLSYLYEREFVRSSGIIIEANEKNNVNMGKYQVVGSEGVHLQKEDIIAGNIRHIVLQLLFKPTVYHQVLLLRETERREFNTTIVELPMFESPITANVENDKRVQNIAQTIDEFLISNKKFKKGIIMQENEEGKGQLMVYSLISANQIKTESQVLERGDIKATIGNLLATASGQKTTTSWKVDENEKGNVTLYKSCIEKGDLKYLKGLHSNESESECDGALEKEQKQVVQQTVEEAKRSLCQQKEQVERTICDILPGDVKNTKKVFSSEAFVTVENCIPKEDIIPGDISSVKQQLATKQSVSVDKEEIVPGDIKATMESLERAKQQSMCVEREIIKPGTIYDIDLSAHGPEIEDTQPQKEVIVSGDVKAAKRSLEIAKQQSMHMEREVIVPGKIYNLGVSAQEESSSTVPLSSSTRCQQIKTHQKVSDTKKDSENQISCETYRQNDVEVSNCAQSIPPFIECQINGEKTEEEIEVLKGDVKAAIRSLKNRSTEKTFLDKEDVVRGSVQLALASLEKSSINISKGDYKAAMIYKNSGKACSRRSKTCHNQCVAVSVPPTDTTLSPSISVTCEGQSSNSAQISTLNPLANGNFECIVPPSQVQDKKEPQKKLKPALPPKPQWMKSVSLEGPTNVAVIPNTTVFNLDPKIPLRQDHQFHTDLVDTPDVNTKETLSGTFHKIHANEVLPDESYQHLEMHSSFQDEKSLKTPLKEEKLHLDSTPCKCNEVQIERNVIQATNETVGVCRMYCSQNEKQEMTMNTKAVPQSFEKKQSKDLDRRALPTKTVKVIYSDASDHKKSDILPGGQEHSLKPSNIKHKTQAQMSNTNIADQPSHSQENKDHGDKVVLRKKKVNETEDERRQRLSVHKDEIMKGNVKAAMEIFENLRKREELKDILSQVQEMEGEASTVDATSLKSLYENVPPWMTTSSHSAKKCKKDEKKVDLEQREDDLESISSVEMAFEDLEKASKEIMKLKDQTMAKLIDIEETIKKALYSVSNLKSEADIVGLSGLFDESLKSEQNQPANSIRKISIVSSKIKSGSHKDGAELASDLTKTEVPEKAHKKPLVRQSSQSSPSFISIHSARKPSEQQKPTMSTFKPNTESKKPACHNPKHDLESTGNQSLKNGLGPERKVSVLEVKAVPEQQTGIIGTKTVSETYEERDDFGNVFVSSVKSTFVTNHPESKASSLFGVVRGPTRYEVMTSPLMKRPGRASPEQVSNNAKEEGTVFVTFSQPKEKQ